MLNIKDIQLRDRREPVEVAEIRRKIEEAFCRLEFQEGPHKYYVHEDDGTVRELPCVSEVTHKFAPYVDWDACAERKAQRLGMAKADLLRQWEEGRVKASNNGTSTHLFGEAYMHFFMGHPEKMSPVVMPQFDEGYLVPYSKKQEAVEAFYTELLGVENIYPVMPETQVYMGLNPDWADVMPYAGTFDMLFAYKASDGEWKLLLYDWKTNAGLTSDYNRKFGNMALAPFDDMVDEDLTYYTLQLNCYALCLNQIGFEVADRKVIWLKEDGTFEKISLPDISERLRGALKINK